LGDLFWNETGGRCLSSFYPQEEQPSDDERQGHSGTIVQSRLYEIVKEESSDAGWNSGENKSKEKATTGARRGELPKRAKESFKVGAYDGKSRAKLDDDFENFSGWSLKMKSVFKENQMSRGGDGKKFGEPLDEAKESGRNVRIHGVPFASNIN
jgi:hypothetical protein